MWKRLDTYLRDISLNIRRYKELELNRRGFLHSTLGLIGLLFLSTLPFGLFTRSLSAKETSKSHKIADLNELKIGESKPFAYPEEHDPALLVRISEKEYRAYHIKCTHLQCPVYWDKPSGKMICPCHNGSFSVEDGSVLAGPPRRPLPSIKLTFRRDGIYATGVSNIHQTKAK